VEIRSDAGCFHEKRRAYISCGFLLISGAAALGVTRAHAQGQASTQTSLSPEQVEAVHSRLYFLNIRLLDKSGRPIPEIQRLIASTSGDIHLQNRAASEDTVGEPTPALFVADMACSHDLVVLGTVGTGTSHITSDNSFLYTDWGFFVERIFKNNSSAQVQRIPQSQLLRLAGR
jgi:hypothetical protein